MKRRKLSNYCNALHFSYNLLLLTSSSCLLLMLMVILQTKTTKTDAAIVPPPWSDPEKNPCASMPGGWQLLYWPPLKKCFKIFTIGYPCPETMELGPTATVGSGGLNRKGGTRNAPIAECRCPPGTALSAKTKQCHKIFERGPCEIGEYFAPIAEKRLSSSNPIPHQHHSQHRWGECRLPNQCPMENMIHWAKDNKCYKIYTKGPCSKGKLLILNDDGLAECKCDRNGVLGKYFYANEDTCYEHYTKGPCSTPGHLFLPGGRCDCHDGLPHFNEDFGMCFELNTLGPCPPGHIYTLRENTTHAQCQCKEGYVPWTNGRCYRLYTRGPCAANEFLINATSCIQNFCGKSRLYFPDQKSCYRIGSQGPCELHQVVVFDFTARPSIDGISYNGMCGCSGVIANLDQQCNSYENSMNGQSKVSGSISGNFVIGFGTATNVGGESDGGTAALTQKTNACESIHGMVELNGICYKLYTRGPCGPGQWLEPLKTQNLIYGDDGNISSKAKCVCRPGYTLAEENNNDDDDESIENNDNNENASVLLVTGMNQRCNAPSVGLARYLNVHQRQRINSKFSARNFNSNSSNLTEFSSTSTEIFRFQFLN